jgi:uncharacterized protein YjiS (DUF1127 family)
MASRFQGKPVLITDCEVMMRPSVSEAIRGIALRFRRWREYQQTCAALRHLDDRQLKEFGIDPRPPDLAQRKFP